MRLPLAVLLALVLAAPASAGVGADHVSSDNVELVRSIKFDVGQTTGAKIVGNRMFVTSAKNLSVYDITKPDDPQLMGLIRANLAWENEEVPTNGKILGISNDFFDLMPSCVTHEQFDPTSCLQLFDVRDPLNIKELPPVPQNGDHTSTCVLDCSFLYGSAGSITDLRGVLEGAQPKDLGDWRPPVRAQGANVQSCHNVRELRPGVLFVACQPYALLSVNAEDGGTPTAPKVMAVGGNADKRFVHSTVWPRQGRDRFAFQGGETNFTGRCGTTNGAFAVIDASRTTETGRFGPVLDQVRPVNGTYADGNTPANPTGCSVHWFEEHPTFDDGGLVALAEYDNGVKFVQITPEGKIVEQGFFQGLAASTSATKWVPGTDIVYSIDYFRGIDVLRWKGDHYVPTASGKVKREKGRVRGTRGRRTVLPAISTGQAATRRAGVVALRARGWQPGICVIAARHAGRS